MGNNLQQLVDESLSDSLLEKTAALLGEPLDITRKGLQGACLKLSKSLDAVRDEEFSAFYESLGDGSKLDKLEQHLAGGNQTVTYLSMGNEKARELLAYDTENDVDTHVSLIAEDSGIKHESISFLLGIAHPFFLGLLGKKKSEGLSSQGINALISTQPVPTVIDDNEDPYIARYAADSSDADLGQQSGSDSADAGSEKRKSKTSLVGLTTFLIILALAIAAYFNQALIKDFFGIQSDTKPIPERTTQNQPTPKTANNVDSATESITPIADTNAYPASTPVGRLPNSVRPLEYKLDLTIDPDQDGFRGVTTIDLESDIETDYLFLHGRDLQVSNVRLTDSAGNEISGEYRQVDASGVARIDFSGTLAKGSSTLEITYSAPFNLSLEGLYKVTDGGLNYAFTQFEATSARLSFPGFDEPAFKVPFTTSLTIKNEHKGFANTPLTAVTEMENGMQRLDFAKSKPLPTYLIAYAVGDLDVVKWDDIPANSIRKKPIPLNGLATKGKGKNLTYALEHTNEILTSLEEYFGIPYPYEKLDIVAAPDFAFGAMENVGLIVYREQLLLFDDTISLDQKRRYANVHGHELAHQWFGNLVTPEWWDDIWLNEAFATWMAHVSNDNVYPEQKFRQTLMGRALGAMANDSLISARQIRQPVNNNHDIDSAFDGITYSKGGGVLRMFESFLGPENFRLGINHYLNKFAFDNATATDFIEAIAENSTQYTVETIRDAFNSFLEQPGIPNLDISTTCLDSNVEVNVKQSRYLPIGSSGSSAQIWKVPVCLGFETAGKVEQQCSLVSKPIQSIKLDTQVCPKFVIPNAGGTGYYRFALNSTDWQTLFSNQDMLGAEEMMAANDSFNASINAGKLSFRDLVQVAPKIIRSDSSRVATAPTELLSFAYDKIAKTKAQKSALANLNRRLYENRFKELGFDYQPDDSVDTIQLRNSLFTFLAKQGESAEVRSHLRKMAVEYTGYASDKQLHPELADSNIIATALAVAAKDIGTPFIQHLMELFENESDGTIRGRLLGAIAEAKDPKLADELRDWTLSEKIRDNEIYTIIFTQLSDDQQKDAAWNWFKQNFDGFIQRVSSFSQGRIPRIASGFCTAEDKLDVEKFFSPLIENVSGGPRSLAQTLESIDLCIAKANHHTPSVANYFPE
ncbi:MAG: M1 family metallopeptidase [Gammaproteobacteria bacterium]|nr:M1 family metallopeptidase [Gammaproteobacteria bacterium]